MALESEEEIARRLEKRLEHLRSVGVGESEPAEELESVIGKLFEASVALDESQELAEGFERFTLHEILGEGGQAVTLRAFDNERSQQVVLRVMQQSGAQTGNQPLAVENAMLTQIDSPYVVRCHGLETLKLFGQPDQLVLVLEYVEGISLDKKLRLERISSEDAAELTRKLAIGLSGVHEAGVIHRDVKPSNVILSSDGVPKLVDFGFAVSSVDASVLPSSGTAAYMSPEQAACAPQIDGRTDVFGLGAVLYEMLTGFAPFRAQTSHDAIQLAKQGKVVDVRELNPQVPGKTAAVCMRALAADPAQRYRSAEEFALALERLKTVGANTSSVLVIGGVLLLGVVAAMFTAHANWGSVDGFGAAQAVVVPSQSVSQQELRMQLMQARADGDWRLAAQVAEEMLANVPQDHGQMIENHRLVDSVALMFDLAGRSEQAAALRDRMRQNAMRAPLAARNALVKQLELDSLASIAVASNVEKLIYLRQADQAKANVYLQKLANGKYDLGLMRKRLVALEQVVGAEHYMTGYAHYRLAKALGMSGDMKSCIEHFNRGKTVLGESLGLEHPVYRFVVSEGAYILMISNQFEQAVQQLNEVCGGGDFSGQAFVYEANKILTARGEALQRIGRLDEAKVDLQKAVALYSCRADGSGLSRNVVDSLRSLASVLEELGETEAAYACIGDALEIYMRDYGADNLHTVETRVQWARVGVAVGRSIDDYALAVDLQFMHGRRNFNLVDTLFAFAETTAEHDDIDRANQAAARLGELLNELCEPGHPKYDQLGSLQGRIAQLAK